MAWRRNVLIFGAPFSFLHRARRILSFRRNEKKEWGAHSREDETPSNARRCEVSLSRTVSPSLSAARPDALSAASPIKTTPKPKRFGVERKTEGVDAQLSRLFAEAKRNELRQKAPVPNNCKASCFAVERKKNAGGRSGRACAAGCSLCRISHKNHPKAEALWGGKEDGGSGCAAFAIIRGSEAERASSDVIPRVPSASG